jgi:hypothetical protein
MHFFGGSLRVGLILLATSVAFVAGCNGDDDDDEIEVTGPEGTVVVDEGAVADYDAAWGFAAVDTFDDPFFVASVPTAAQIDPNDAASQAATAAGTYFAPPGCVQASASGNVATYVLNGCTGPLGLVDVTGTVTATFTDGDGPLQVQIAGTGVTVGGVDYSVASTAVVTADGSTRNVSLTSTTAPSGVTRNAQYDFSWTQGTPCITLDGSGTTMVDSTTTTTTISDYARCSGQCPSAGVVSTTGPNGTATLTFDGTSTPTVTDTTGAQSEITLACGS